LPPETEVEPPIEVVKASPAEMLIPPPELDSDDPTASEIAPPFPLSPPPDPVMNDNSPESPEEENPVAIDIGPDKPTESMVERETDPDFEIPDISVLPLEIKMFPPALLELALLVLPPRTITFPPLRPLPAHKVTAPPSDAFDSAALSSILPLLPAALNPVVRMIWPPSIVLPVIELPDVKLMYPGDPDP
jgi:hypothetical protein